MRSLFGVPLFFLSTLFVVSDCDQYHGEYEAQHQTALWRRQKPRKPQGAALAQGARFHQDDDKQKEQVKEDERMMNMTTTLQDMKTEYIGTIGVGTDANGEAQFEARVVFDTGSTNLWVASVLCKDFPCNTDRGSQFYDPDKSTSQEDFMGEGETLILCLALASSEALSMSTLTELAPWL